MNSECGKDDLRSAILRIQQAATFYRIKALSKRVLPYLSREQIEEICQRCTELLIEIDNRHLGKYTAHQRLKVVAADNLKNFTLREAVDHLIRAADATRFEIIRDDLLPEFSSAELKLLLSKIDELKTADRDQTSLHIPANVKLNLIHSTHKLKNASAYKIYTNLVVRERVYGTIPDFKGESIGSFLPIQQLPEVESPDFVRYKTIVLTNGNLEFTNEFCNCVVLTHKTTGEQKIAQFLDFKLVYAQNRSPTIVNLSVRYYDPSTQKMGNSISYSFPDCMGKQFNPKIWKSVNLEHYPENPLTSLPEFAALDGDY